MRLLLCAAATLLFAGPLFAVDFSQTIRPILSDHCFQCHGPDEKERAGDLRLDTEEGVAYAFAGGVFDESEAWRRIHSDDPDEQMPPPEFPKPLTATEIKLLENWMSDGTPWSQHWAFAKPVRIAPPDIDGTDHPIDRFIIERLRQEGLNLSKSANRETLIRRLKFDLLGLPPTPAETTEFLSDKQPRAYDRLVDRMLASPHFGERMAIEWLDGARYADTNGYQNDFKRSMWPWRDWVINAFNENLPYDQFIIEQLAGDMLPDPTINQRIATGFNRNHRTVTEAGSIQQEWLVENVIDRVETTATVVLGLTMGCARCHDHKYDPISQREFYQFFSFFYNVKEKGVYQETRGNVAPLQPILPPEDIDRLDSLRAELAKFEAKFKKLQKSLPAKAVEWKATDLPEAASADSPSSDFALGLLGSTDARLRDGSLIKPQKQSGDIGWKPSVFGEVAQFSGLHELSYGQVVSPNSDEPFSFAFWVKPEKMGSIVDKIDLELQSRGFDIFWQRDGRIEMHLIHSWPSDALKVAAEAENSVPRSEWSHVVVSYDGSKQASGVSFHVNGKSIKTKAINDELKSSIEVAAPFRICVKSRDRMFFGQLFDLRYFEQKLADRDIVKTANEGLARMLARERESLSKDDTLGRETLFGKFSQSQFAKTYRETAKDVAAAKEELAKLEAAQTVMVMEELAEPRQAYVLKRGEYDKPDKDQPVHAEIPAFLGSLPDDEEKNRLALAKWMVSAENPLVARVRVNRIWQMLFGVGLVKTSENFGVQAEAPSHPELLDWLATEYIRLDWDTKALLKLIITSNTYRQSSVITEKHLAKDPQNRLLARGPRFRLPAEMIRDNALAVSGLLTPKIGGPSVKPYQPPKVWEELAGGAGEGPYVQSKGDDLYRRSIYTYRKRTVPHPTSSTFDAPSFEICQVARARTNTPLQALALLNDVTYVEASRKLGERMLAEGGSTESARLEYGFRLVTGRRPDDAELELLVGSLQRKLNQFANHGSAAREFLSHGEFESLADYPPEQLAAYSAVASVLLNLDEAITKE